MEPSVPVRAPAGRGVAPLATVTGNQKLRQLPVHLIVPLASCSGVYSVFPDWSVSTVPTPAIWRVEMAAAAETPPLAQPATSPATAAAARPATRACACVYLLLMVLCLLLIRSR